MASVLQPSVHFAPVQAAVQSLMPVHMLVHCLAGPPGVQLSSQVCVSPQLPLPVITTGGLPALPVVPALPALAVPPVSEPAVPPSADVPPVLVPAVAVPPVVPGSPPTASVPAWAFLPPAAVEPACAWPLPP